MWYASCAKTATRDDALLWRERRGPDLIFATHDPQQARAARALGFECVGV